MIDELSCAAMRYLKAVRIGTQEWMPGNLNVRKFRNGDLIPEIRTNEEWLAAAEKEMPAWCFFDNFRLNGTPYGKLYNWHAVNDPRGLAPEGWHIPGDEEWTVLAERLGGTGLAGIKLKSRRGWDWDGNGTNESGFNARPGCRRDAATGLFRGIEDDGLWWKDDGFWWTSTASGRDMALLRHLSRDSAGIEAGALHKGSGLSVRCVRDPSREITPGP